MNTNEIRVANLIALTKQEKSTSAFAKKYDLDSTYLSQIMTGHRSFGEKSARNIETKLGLEKGWLDTPQEATQMVTMLVQTPAEQKIDFIQRSFLRPIETWNNEDELDPDLYVFIPSLDIKLSAGNGNVIWEVSETGQKHAFSARWVQRMGINPNRAAIMEASGSSMAPRILDGDHLVVDYAQRTILDGKVYAIVMNGEVYVKRLFKEFDGGLRVVSDNPDKTLYPDKNIPANAVNQLELIGQIVAISGGM